MDKTNKKLLPIALRKPNMFWYEMSTKNMADFVVNINFDKSLFIAMLDKRSFFDQRMIGFSIKEQYKDENKIFLLALLNNILRVSDLAGDWEHLTLEKLNSRRISRYSIRSYCLMRKRKKS